MTITRAPLTADGHGAFESAGRRGIGVNNAVYRLATVGHRSHPRVATAFGGEVSPPASITGDSTALRIAAATAQSAAP